MSALSLNQSDVFVLDGGADGWIWQWNGSLASKRYLNYFVQHYTTLSYIINIILLLLTLNNICNVLIIVKDLSSRVTKS